MLSPAGYPVYLTAIALRILDRLASLRLLSGYHPTVAETHLPLERELEEIGAQLAWVRDYL